MNYLITYYSLLDMVVEQKVIKEINSIYDLRVALENFEKEELYSFDIISIVALPYSSTTNYFKEIERN